jgi:hypothetical protein
MLLLNQGTLFLLNVINFFWLEMKCIDIFIVMSVYYYVLVTRKKEEGMQQTFILNFVLKKW